MSQALIFSDIQHIASHLNKSLEAVSLLKEQDLSIKERLNLLIFRDLNWLGWENNLQAQNVIELTPPLTYEKPLIQAAMAYSRNEIIRDNQEWIDKHILLARNNLASGNDVLKSKIMPRLEICETQVQHNLFRILRYYWSSPSSEYVGRRMKFLVRDDGIDGSPIIGIMALGSSIIHIPERDKWIGWDKGVRTERIIYMMDAYVLGALPPYNNILGGKLLSYMLASNEIRRLYARKYADTKTIILGRKANDLALIMTTSLYGAKSSQYNRVNYNNNRLFLPIGVTSGYGSSHISQETFSLMRVFASQNNFLISNKFGSGPNWRMRVIRTVCDHLNLSSDVILKHSFQRGIYAIPLASNSKEFLQGNDDQLNYHNYPLDSLINHWRERWLNMRLQNSEVIERITNFNPSTFSLQSKLHLM